MLNDKAKQILDILGMQSQSEYDFWSPTIQINLQEQTGILDFYVVQSQTYISPKKRHLLLNLK